MLKITMLFALIFVSCGKETSDSDNRGGRDVRVPGDNRIITDVQQYIRDQKVSCGEGNCPEYLARIIAIDKKEAVLCTGVLLNENTLMTSTSCLPEKLRIAGVGCSGRIYALFNNNGQTDITSCKTILEADKSPRFLEPAMWKGDYLLFNIHQNVSYQAAQVSGAGMLDGQKLDIWKYDFVDSVTSVLKKDRCTNLHETYLNPFATDGDAPMQVISGCKTTVGAQGAALIDSSHSLVATLSQEMSGTLYNIFRNRNIVSGELSRYYHATNVACVPSLNPNFNSKRCQANINLNRLDSLRAQMLAGEGIHASRIGNIEMDLEQLKNYFEWDFTFRAPKRNRAPDAPRTDGSVFEVDINKPKCIYQSANWIEEFRAGRRSYYSKGTRTITVPNMRFFTKLDQNLRPFSEVKQDGEKTFTFEFNPFTSHFRDGTYVQIKSNFFGEEKSVRFENIKRCL